MSAMTRGLESAAGFKIRAARCRRGGVICVTVMEEEESRKQMG